MRALRHFLALVLFAALPAAAQGASPTATISWTAPTAYVSGAAITGAITYNLYQGTQGAALAKVQSALSATTATVTAGLTAGTTQCFAVTAVVNSVESAQSTTACTAIAFPTPGAPSQITVVVH